MIENIRPDVLNPPAIVVAAFDEARALEEIKAAVAARDEAKGEFKDAILVIGQKLIEARRAMPGIIGRNGRETYSSAFLAFVEQCGLSIHTARSYVTFARDPKRLERHRGRTHKGNNKRFIGRLKETRRCALEEVRDLLQQAPDLETAQRIIQEELDEIK